MFTGNLLCNIHNTLEYKLNSHSLVIQIEQTYTTHSFTPQNVILHAHTWGMVDKNIFVQKKSLQETHDKCPIILKHGDTEKIIMHNR